MSHAKGTLYVLATCGSRYAYIEAYATYYQNDSTPTAQSTD